MRVREIMTKNPVCCWPSTSALAAALMLQERDVGILPVIQDPFTPRLLGVITDRDLCLYVVAAGRDPACTWVDGCMTGEPVCCSGEDDVSHALELMEAHQVRRVPVVNEKHEIVGMLSFSDVVRKSDIDSGVIAAAFRNICEPAPAAKQPIERTLRAA
jgi:CBS domain-containing protein